MKKKKEIVAFSLSLVVLAIFMEATPAYAGGGHSHGKKSKTLVQKKSISTSVSEIKKVLHGYAKMVNVKDVVKMGLFLDRENFSVVQGKQANWDWEDYRDKHLKPEFSRRNIKLLNYKVMNVRVEVGQMFSYAIFETQLEYELDGEKKLKHEVGTAIFERKGNGWLIRHIHAS
ncbi:nuclear transport factor 2 family protein [Paremcibacter congregatus]|uniref:nuclear transport factor 2 family protein n=1 Tax=Paremcibacter congregatus TaxID=2043170 RepID=UPI0030EEE250